MSPNNNTPTSAAPERDEIVCSAGKLAEGRIKSLPITKGLLDSKYMKRCLYWIDRVPLEIKSTKNFNTDNWQIKGYARFSLGFSDWRFAVCNIPA